jgi:hypothetical protein
VHQSNGRIPSAYPCPQVQDAEFAGYDMDTVLHGMMSAGLSYTGHGGGCEFFEYQHVDCDLPFQCFIPLSHSDSGHSAEDKMLGYDPLLHTVDE